ncbi:MAG TPA: condensation domain-containing protein, partial [Thermoanaerobaculia bacterium]
SGPLLRLAYFRLGTHQPGRLLIIAHHLVVDGISWRILLEDLETAYARTSRGGRVELPAKTASYREAAQRLRDFAASAEAARDAAYWLGAQRLRVPDLPVDFAQGENSVATAQTLSVTLDQEETTSLLQQLPRAYQTQINDALLTALALACQPWTGSPVLLVDVEGHGRHEEIFGDLELLRTVGWLTAIYPVILDTSGEAEPSQALRTVKEQLRQVPGHGIAYGALFHAAEGSSPLRADLRALPRAQISFNYLGQLDQTLSELSPFRPAPESSGLAQSRTQPRSHLLGLTAGVLGGEMILSWTYSDRLHRRATIQRLAGRFLEALRHLIAQSGQAAEEPCVPADFPLLAGLGQEQLDRIISQVSEFQD